MTLILICTCFISVFATDYTGFDLVFEEKNGENVNATEIRIFAAIDEGALIDRTESFTMEDVAWFKYLPEPEDGKTAEDYDYVDEELKVYGMLCGDEEVFDLDHYSYFLRIARLYANEEDTFYRNVKINGVDIDEMNGSCYNTGSEFYIKTITNGQGSSSGEEEQTDVPEQTTADPDTDPEQEKSKCKLCGICPVQPLGICLFIWIAVILLIVIILVIVIAVACTKKKKKEKQD